MLAITFVGISLLAPQGDWPQFRGPDRTGSVASRDWSPVGRAEPLWARNVGKGYSSPSIAGDRLVTIGFDEKAAVDRIVCLHAISGALRWKFEFAATDKPMYHGGGTLTTPTIHAGRVYCVSRTGKLHVFDLGKGGLLWSQDYGEQLKLEKTFHGFCASPLIDGDRIYLQLGGLVLAVAKRDGDVIWRSEDHGDASYSNLALLQAGGKPALGAMLGETFYVFARADGDVLHEYPWKLRGGAVHCAIPVPVEGDRVFLSTVYGKGCAMLRLGAEKAPEVIWVNRRMRNKVTACVQHDGHLYGFDESMLRCLDLDGNSKWRVRGLGLGSLTIAGGRLLVLNSDGELIVAEASPEEFRELSRRKVLDEGAYWTSPVLVNGLVYVRNSLGDLRCLDHRAGAASAATEPKAIPGAPASTSFERHAKLVDAGAFESKGKALRIRGTWSVPLRGLDAGEMTWTLVAPDRWDLRLDSGHLLYTYDGQRAWAIEPQGPRLVTGDELRESRLLFPLRDLFAPECPPGAKTVPSTVRFADTECWEVTAKGKDGQVSYHFDVASGRLRGTTGTGRSTIVYHGAQKLGGLTLPKRITRFRVEDGQEHVLVLRSAEWVDLAADFFALPRAVRRVMRTPAEIARDSAKLRKRFAGVLGKYQAKDKSTPLKDDVIEMRVDKGEFWFGAPEGSDFRVAVENEKDGVFPLDGPPIRISVVADDDGRATGIKVHLPGPGNESVLLHRLKD